MYDVKIKIQKYRLVGRSDKRIQFHNQGEEFNISKLPKSYYGDE